MASFYQGKLWISYFDEGSTVPPPFNMVPTPKAFVKVLTCKKKKMVKASEEDRQAAEQRYLGWDSTLGANTIKQDSIMFIFQF